LYLGGDFYTAAAVYVRENGGAWQLYYICRDYLGSITHLTNSAGAVVQELSYDAWGRLRNPANQQAYTQGQEPELFLGRGYTGHEHLAQFGLVNMNARLYDPAVGRFLSPDPYVQNPLFSQNYNRYSYVLNNPLRYTDPTGEYALVDDIIAFVIGGTVNVIVNIGNINCPGEAISYFVVGGASGVVTIYAGPIVGGALMGAGNNFVNQGFGTTGNWNWDNIKYDQVLMSGAIGAGMSYLGGELSGYISPYISNLVSGIGGQAVQQGIVQGVSGFSVGFALGTGSALMNGESFEDALGTGFKNGLFGLAVGTVSGVANGPGTQRIIIGKGGEYYYSPDHYKTFIRFKY